MNILFGYGLNQVIGSQDFHQIFDMAQKRTMPTVHFVRYPITSFAALHPLQHPALASEGNTTIPFTQYVHFCDINVPADVGGRCSGCVRGHGFELRRPMFALVIREVVE
jgi:hypothetical protein